ncbi:MAG: TetR/AcrR family transcriptional regulator [Pseudomonadota bacterium]
MARKPQFEREAALTNAMNLFWKQGYHATSMKDIELALDMRPGSIYAAFGSKQELFQEAIVCYGDQTRAMFAEVLATGNSELEGLKNLLLGTAQRYHEHIPSKACMLVKVLLELSNQDTVDSQSVKSYMNDLQEMFEEKFQRAIDAGEIFQQADAKRLAHLFQTNVIGLSVMAQRDVSVGKIEQLADDMILHILPMG